MKNIIIKSFVLFALLYALSFPLAVNASMLSNCLLTPNCKLQTSVPSTPPSSQVMPLLKANIDSNNVFPPKTNSQKTPILGSPTTMSLLKASIPSSPVSKTSKPAKETNNGCTATTRYSPITGKICTLISDCTTGHLYSFLTGRRCNPL